VLYPGRSFTLTGHPAGADGVWFVTSISISSASDTDRSFVTRFTAVRGDTTFRPSSSARAPKQPGLALGTVVAAGGDEVFPDPHARVRVQMHWDREGKKDDSAGWWMRVSQRNTPGSMLFPRTGWNVATLHEEGNVDAPWVLSRIHDDNKTRVVYKTATTPGGGTHNEIHFEDAKGREEVYWNATKDLVIHTEATKVERVDRDAEHHVGRDQRVETDESWSEIVRRDQQIEIGAKETITVKAAREKVVTGTDSATIGGSRSLHVGEAYSHGVDGSRSLKVGAAQLDISLGTISNVAKVSSVLIGAASVKLSKGNVTEEAPKVGITTVGVAKLEMAGMNVSTQIDGDMTETILGSVTVDAGGRYLDTTDTTSKHVAGGALSVKAKKEAKLEAKTSITLICGASVVRVTEDKIEISSDEVKLDGEGLDIQTAKIRHNG
jgi:type VI secretion system secreted protein VgrG